MPENTRGKILITGGAGGLGKYFTRMFVKDGWSVRVFDLPTPANKQTFPKPENNIEPFWGDITNKENVFDAVKGMDAVLHMAALIVPATENNPQLAHNVNVGGTQLVTQAAQQESEKRADPLRLMFSSSVTVYGVTNHETPPITKDHPLNPVDNYNGTKILAEEIIRNSGLPWTIFRFAATLYLKIRKGDFGQMRMIPPDNRIEIAHLFDVADGIINSLKTDEAKHKIFVMGGGKDCQLLYRDQIKMMFKLLGFPDPDWKKFTDKPFYLDWYDTTEEQRILKFQKRKYADYLEDFKKANSAQYLASRYLASPFMQLLRIHL